MKTLIKTCLFSVMLVLPAAAKAQGDAETKSAGSMNCPMMADKGVMQKNMGAMMENMNAMMTNVSDPAMKMRMEKLHDQMAAMMAKMQMMSGGMKGGAMMKGEQKGGDAPAASPSVAPNDHETHHPVP